LIGLWHNLVALITGQAQGQLLAQHVRAAGDAKDERCRVANAALSAAPANVQNPVTPGAATNTNGQDPLAALANEITVGNVSAAHEEIRHRIEQQYLLFVLKFSIVGSILWALFQALHRSEHVETLVRTRRAGVLCCVALLGASVVDTALRFDAKLMEARGTYGWCVENAVAPHQSTHFPGWEHLLLPEIEQGVFPLMRNFSVTLSVLLFAVVLYAFLIMPKGAHRSTLRIVLTGTTTWFGVLVVIGASYPGAEGSAPLTWPLISLLIGAAGSGACAYAIHVKKEIGHVLIVVPPFVRKLRHVIRACGNGSPALVNGFGFDVHFLARLASAEECLRLTKNRLLHRRPADSQLLPGSFEVRAFARALTGDVELAEDFLWRFYDDARLKLAGGTQVPKE
jgi:hypothetical protein